jgi:hypothetical protein
MVGCIEKFACKIFWLTKSCRILFLVWKLKWERGEAWLLFCFSYFSSFFNFFILINNNNNNNNNKNNKQKK